MQGVNISDYELIEALNQAVSLLYSRLSEKYVFTAVKKITLIVDEEGSSALPTDFISVYRVGLGEEGYAAPNAYRPCPNKQYRISGNTFYAPEGAYGLEYYYLPEYVSNLTDRLDVSPSVSPYLEKITLSLLSGDFQNAEQLAQVCCHALGGGEISHFEDTGPVQVLGGKL